MFVKFLGFNEKDEDGLNFLIEEFKIEKMNEFWWSIKEICNGE